MFDFLLDKLADSIVSTNEKPSVQSEVKKPARVVEMKPKSVSKQEEKPYKNFNEFIKIELDKRAEQDKLFAKMYSKEHKSIDECVKYIVGEMYQRCVRNGNYGYAVNDCADNSDLIAMAIHYYCEDDIEIQNIGGSVQVKKVETPTQDNKPKAKMQVSKNPDTDEDLFADFFNND